MDPDLGAPAFFKRGLAIAGIESRGFLLGAAVAARLDAGCVASASQASAAKAVIERTRARYVGASIVVDQLSHQLRDVLAPCDSIIAADLLAQHSSKQDPVAQRPAGGFEPTLGVGRTAP